MLQRTVLGLDASTQSLTAVLVDRDTGRVVAEHSFTYPPEVWMPVEHPGQADQSATVFVQAFARLLRELRDLGAPLASVEAIGVSAQQHGCAFLGPDAAVLLASLRQPRLPDDLLSSIADTFFSHPRCPIWMTSDTTPYAEALRQAAGGSAAMIALTGSDSPLRFTGALIRKFGEEHPHRYERTSRIALLSQLYPMLLTGTLEVPVDWGNGSGTSLMDYQKKTWSPLLVEACAKGLPGGTEALKAKLGALASPLTVAGKIAPWYVEQFGFSASCEVLIGSGDNPQSKVPVSGHLLSLGTSFVLMAEQGTGSPLDARGWGNAMYDGRGRAFVFGCRTNGALVWDQLRQAHGADFAKAEAALNACAPGLVLALNQPLTESFPPSPAVSSTAAGESFDRQWAAAVDSSLGLLFLGSRPWLSQQGSTGATSALSVTGGPSSSAALVRRIAAFANRPVRVTGAAGAALGAAAGAHLAGLDPAQASLAGWVPTSQEVLPRPEDVSALHAPGGYLDQLKQLFKTTTGIDPTGERK
jgi:xylulokinase